MDDAPLHRHTRQHQSERFLESTASIGDNHSQRFRVKPSLKKLPKKKFFLQLRVEGGHGRRTELFSPVRM
jgi:hypothetical protein